MNRWRARYNRIPLHWKLTILSAVLLSALFAASSAAQYTFVERWMIKQEKLKAQREMHQLLNVLLAKELSPGEANYRAAQQLLEKRNISKQMIRILDQDGLPVLAVANDIPLLWMERQGEPPPAYDTTTLNGDMLVLQSPITIFSFTGSVEMVRNIDNVRELIDAFNRIMIICCLVAVLLSGLIGRLLSRLLVKPLQQMNDTMRSVKQNGLQERMPMSGAKDDIASLQAMFNEMMDEVEQSFHQQKQFVEDASHELRTPVAIIEGHLSLLKRWGKENPAIVEESMAIALDELARLRGLVEELLQLSRSERLVEETDAKEGRCDEPEAVIEAAVGKTRALHPSFQFELCLEALRERALAIHGRHLEQLLLIVLDNAVKYSGESRRIEVTADLRDSFMELSVRDYGVGIAEADLPYVWDRFYRVDKARNRTVGGYGLGLSIARRLTEQYGGSIELTSELGEGTTVTMKLPLSDPI